MNLANLTRAQLRARQREVEHALGVLEAEADLADATNTETRPHWSLMHRTLMAEWEAIESEWTRRAGVSVNQDISEEESTPW